MNMMKEPKRLFDFPYYQLENFPLEKMMTSRLNGEWTTISTVDFVKQMNLVSRGLISLGIAPGDRVALITHANRMEWDIMDNGIMQIGAIDVPIYPTMTEQDCEYIMNHAETRLCFVSNKELYDKLILLRTHGITKDQMVMKENHGGWYYEMIELGFNYRLTDMQAALGITQLKRADEGLVKRKAIALKYDEALKSLNSKIVTPLYDNGHAFHLYVIRVKDGKRLDLYNYLKSKNIFPQVHYIPVHTMPYYKQFGYKNGDFPLSEAYYKECLSLPMYPALTKEEQDYVINSIKEFFQNA